MKIGLYYGSTTGNTESVADRIALQFKGDEATVERVSNFSISKIGEFDLLIFGSSTWGDGELQDDWLDRLDIIKNINLTKTKIAFFGLGDACGWPGTFVDAMGLLYEATGNPTDNTIGQTELDTYSFTSSKAVINNKFIGLAIDETNQPELTDKRIESWVVLLKTEISRL